MASRAPCYSFSMSNEPCPEILVVDDEEAIRELLKTALELAGHAVTVAANGREALDRLAEMQCPRLILLDLMMPVMNGWEFVEALGRDPARAVIPVVVITAFSGEGRPIRAQEVLNKPVDLEHLFRLAERYCPKG